MLSISTTLHTLLGILLVQSVQGRFISPDPVAGITTEPQSLNACSYVMNNPVNSVDPTGFFGSWFDSFDVEVGNGNGFYVDGLSARPSAALGLLSSGGGVQGPFNTTQYDSKLGTFVNYTVIDTECGAKAGWIPPWAHYLGAFTWGWADWNHLSEDGAPLSRSVSFKDVSGWFWRDGRWELHMWGGRYDAYGSKIGIQPQGVETDWDAQLIMAAPFAGAMRAAAGRVGGQVLKGAIADVVPKTLAEQLTLEEAESQGGKIIMRNLADAPRLQNVYGPGQWVKMQWVHRALDGSKTVVHWFRNLATSQNAEFKFVP